MLTASHCSLLRAGSSLLRGAPLRVLIISALTLLSANSAAQAARCTISSVVAHVIDNGLAPPNPDNVIDFDAPLDNLCVQNGTEVDLVSGGLVNIELFVFDSSLVRIDGGRVGANAFAAGNSRIELSGDGIVEDSLTTEDTATAVVDGGTVQFLTSIESSRIEVHGISFNSASSRIHVNNNGRIDIFGDNFAINGQPVGFGPVPLTPYPFGTLTGTLESGQPLDIFYQVQTGFGRTASLKLVFAEVPEPSTTLLLACGLVVLGVWRRLL